MSNIERCLAEGIPDEEKHCAHSWTHDRCCWCGAIWGEGGKKYVPAELLEGAVDRKAAAQAIRDMDVMRAFDAESRDDLAQAMANAALDAALGGQ